MEVCSGTPFLLPASEPQGSGSEVLLAGPQLQVSLQRQDGVPDGVRDGDSHQPGQEQVGQSFLPVSLSSRSATNDAKSGEAEKHTRIS